MTLGEKNKIFCIGFFLLCVKSIRFSQVLKVSYSMVDPKLFTVWFFSMLHLLLAIYFWVFTSKASTPGSLGGDTEKRTWNYISRAVLAVNFRSTSPATWEATFFPHWIKRDLRLRELVNYQSVWVTQSWVGKGTLVCLPLNPWPFYHTWLPLRGKS